MIPDQAVRAAVSRAAELRRDSLPLTQGEFARELLEAAAPHLMAAPDVGDLAKLIQQVDEDEFWDPDPGIYEKYAQAIIAAGYKKQPA